MMTEDQKQQFAEAVSTFVYNAISLEKGDDEASEAMQIVESYLSEAAEHAQQSDFDALKRDLPL